tara:strand:+ start:297 stop:524 length:228 start_codon:yes stop_codon:yes gene_type:complete
VQKLFNVLSVLSFVMSAGMLGSSVMLYSRLPGMIIRYADSITGDVTGKVTEMIPDEIESVMPELPTETGLPIKFP